MKRFFTWVALLAFGTVSAVAVARVVRTELRPTITLDRPGLEAWLLEPAPDKPPSPGAVRRAAWMLERDFHNGYDWTPFYRGLDAPAQRCFTARWSLLLEEMFLQRARQFAAVPTPQKIDYLESQLAILASWYALDEKGAHVVGPALLSRSIGASGTKSNLNAADVRHLDEFRSGLAKYAAQRLLRRLMPGATPDKSPPRDD